MKILFLINTINYGGAFKMFVFLANQLAEKGNEVHIYTFDDRQPNYKLNDNIIYHPSEDKINNKIYLRFSSLVKVKLKVNEIKPDIIVSFLPNANVNSVLATLNTDIKSVITERSDPYSEQGWLLNLKRKIYNFADGGVFQTIGAKEYYPINIQKKSVVIPNPVTIPSINRISSDNRSMEIAFVARFDIKQKRQDLMVEAFEIIHKKNKDIILGFYGDGPDMNYIQKMVKNKKLDNNVKFYGKVDNIKERILDSLMFISTSDYEGISNSLTEAMALGLPVIATNSSPGGSKLLIGENNCRGILVSRDDPNEIAEAALKIVNNNALSDEIGKRAQEITVEYSPHKIVEKWQNYLEGIINNVYPGSKN